MQKFFNPSSGNIGLEGVVLEIAKFVKEEPECFYRLVIGSDSQTKGYNGTSEIDFVTAIIIHRIGHGAKYFWNREKVFKAPVLRDKIYTETLRSLDTAQALVPNLRTLLNGINYELEIHIDVGPNGKTREMIKEVVGMVSGSGYVAKTKPDSWGASSVADKHT